MREWGGRNKNVGEKQTNSGSPTVLANIRQAAGFVLAAASNELDVPDAP